MEFHYSLVGGDPASRDMVCFHNTTTMVYGALVMRGATAGTDSGFCVVASGACADAVGVLIEEYLSTVTDSTQSGTYNQKRRVIIAPHAVYLAKYGVLAADDLAATSATTTVTVGSLENNIDGGWVYTVNSNTNYELRLLTASASGSATLKSAFSTALASGDYIIKILPRFHQLAVVNTAADKLSSTAAVGTARLHVVENYMKCPGKGIPMHPLDPVADGARTLDATGEIFSDVVATDHAFMPLS